MSSPPARGGYVVLHRHTVWGQCHQSFQTLGIEPVFNFQQLGIIGRPERIMRAIYRAGEKTLPLLATVRRRNIPPQGGTRTQLG